MIRLIRTAFLAAAMLTAVEALAQDARIAIVNLQRLTTATIEGKKATEKLEKRYQEIVAEMEKLSKAIEAKESTLRTQERTLSTTRRDQLVREIDADKRNLTRKNEDYQQELAELEQDVMGPVMQTADTILAAYLKEKGYTIVLNSAAENSNLVWFNAANDITEDVIKVIDAQAKPAEAASPAAGTTAKPAPPPEKPAGTTPPASAPAADK